MNKTLSIALAGFSFIIEEKAYLKLNDYLLALKQSLEAEEAEEVMHDIELRMVEIFKQSLGNRDVINDEDVEKVIAQIGSPEQIEEQEKAYFSDENSKTKTSNSAKASQKQLFRNPEDQKLGGVCSGLAVYLGMNIATMRIIWIAAFIILCFAHGSALIPIVLYVILWIVLPIAKTTSDLLKMQGKPVNFDNLKNESAKVVTFANDSARSVGKFIAENDTLKKTGNGCLNIFLYFFGIIFAIIGISLLIGSFSIFGFGTFKGFNLYETLNFYMPENYFYYITASFIFLTMFIPAFIFLLLAIRIFSPKTKLKYTGYVIGALFFVWLGLLIFGGMNLAKTKTQFTGQNEETENISLNINKTDNILVDVRKVPIGTDFKSYWNDVYSDKKTVYKNDYPVLNVIRKDDVKNPYLIVKKQANGYNLPLDMSVPVEVRENKIFLPNYYFYPYKYRIRNYSVDYDLVVPTEMKVSAADGVSIHDSSKDIDNQKVATADSLNSKVKMNIGGLQIESINNSDSLVVNGKRMSKAEADSVLKGFKKGFKLNDLKNFDIKIEDGKSKISIETK